MAYLSHLARVLVVEDEAIIALDIESTLLDAGVAEVITVATVAGALSHIEAGALDAAVLDLHLGPNHWTYDVAHALVAKNIPFIFSSGTVDIAEGFSSVPLVTKPFSTEQLLTALLQVTAATAAEKAAE